MYEMCTLTSKLLAGTVSKIYMYMLPKPTLCSVWVFYLIPTLTVYYI